MREARERHEAVAHIVMGKGWPFAAAASDVDLPGKTTPAVLLLAKPIDDAAVRKLAEKSRGAVLLSDGAHAVIEAGPEPERDLLRTAVGAEGRGPIFESPEGSPNGAWAAAVSPLVPGLWLWSYASGAAAANDADTTAVATTATIWSVAGLLALVAIFVGLRSQGVSAQIDQPDGGLDGAAGTTLDSAAARAATGASPAFRTRPGLGEPSGRLPGSQPRGTRAAIGNAPTELHRTD